jgi:hypothetical protein
MQRNGTSRMKMGPLIRVQRWWERTGPKITSRMLGRGRHSSSPDSNLDPALDSDNASLIRVHSGLSCRLAGLLQPDLTTLKSAMRS